MVKPLYIVILLGISLDVYSRKWITVDSGLQNENEN